MGIGPGYRHRGEPYDPPVRVVDPYSVVVKQASYCMSMNCTVALMEYSDYDRVMIIEGTIDNVTKWDPHFKENKRILARFPATKEGYDNALAYVAFMAGGECDFEWLPGFGYNSVVRSIDLGNK